MLTDREKECVKLASKGLSSKEIASAIGASKRTVEAHLRSARNKLNARNTVNLVSIAQRSGLISAFFLALSFFSYFGQSDFLRPSRSRGRVVRTVRTTRSKNEWEIIV